MNVNLEYWSDVSGSILAWWFANFVHVPAVLYANAFDFSQTKTESVKEEVRTCHLELVREDKRYGT